MGGTGRRGPIRAGDFFAPLEKEVGDFRKMLTGRVLNAGAGFRDIGPLVDGELTNQDIQDGSQDSKMDVVSPLDSIPFTDGYFDVVFCNAVLEHVRNPEKVMAEFSRVVKPGGHIYLAVPFMQPEHLDPTDFQRYTLDGLGELCERHGFTVVESGGLHNVYTTLGWICLEYADSLGRVARRILRSTVLPLLRRRALRSERHVHRLASAYRVVGKRTA